MNQSAAVVLIVALIMLVPLGGMAVGIAVNWLRTKERLLAIEKGVTLPPPEHVHEPKDPWEIAASFRVGGLITVAVGAGLFILFAALYKSVSNFPAGVIAVGAIPFLVGLALLYEYRARIHELGPRPSSPALAQRQPRAGV